MKESTPTSSKGVNFHRPLPPKGSKPKLMTDTQYHEIIHYLRMRKIIPTLSLVHTTGLRLFQDYRTLYEGKQ